jgi:hypothetical protein
MGHLWFPINIIIEDLVKYQFLGTRKSLSEGAITSAKGNFSHYYLRDAPLAIRHALKSGKNSLATASGRLFEDMVRDMIKEQSSNEWTVCWKTNAIYPA